MRDPARRDHRDADNGEAPGRRPRPPNGRIGAGPTTRCAPGSTRTSRPAGVFITVDERARWPRTQRTSRTPCEMRLGCRRRSAIRRVVVATGPGELRVIVGQGPAGAGGARYLRDQQTLKMPGAHPSASKTHGHRGAVASLLEAYGETDEAGRSVPGHRGEHGAAPAGRQHRQELKRVPVGEFLEVCRGQPLLLRFAARGVRPARSRRGREYPATSSRIRTRRRTPCARSTAMKVLKTRRTSLKRSARVPRRCTSASCR